MFTFFRGLINSTPTELERQFQIEREAKFPNRNVSHFWDLASRNMDVITDIVPDYDYTNKSDFFQLDISNHYVYTKVRESVYGCLRIWEKKLKGQTEYNDSSFYPLYYDEDFELVNKFIDNPGSLSKVELEKAKILNKFCSMFQECLRLVILAENRLDLWSQLTSDRFTPINYGEDWVSWKELECKIFGRIEELLSGEIWFADLNESLKREDEVVDIFNKFTPQFEHLIDAFCIIAFDKLNQLDKYGEKNYRGYEQEFEEIVTRIVDKVKKEGEFEEYEQAGRFFGRYGCYLPYSTFELDLRKHIQKKFDIFLQNK
jgi:hypothetical protein